LKHLIRIAIALLVISWAWRYGRETFNRWVERTSRVDFSTPATPAAAGSFFGFPSGEHFSPGENLERLDYEVVRSAHHSIDIAMYAFTDRVLASAVIAAAQRGVQVRIYRDGGQYEEEEERAFRYGSTTDMFRGQPNIHIRVKPPSRWLLMHEKDVCADRSLLRTGSANWSQSGEKRQDNDSDYVADRQAIERFERNFEVLWNRRSNFIVQ
jgi:phosphatidylserine/phosphatidylglycerophosphate/cardiolipin synthase-like enzyme